MNTQAKISMAANVARTSIAAVVLTAGSIVLNTSVQAQTAPTTEQTQNVGPVAKPDATTQNKLLDVTDADFVRMAGQGNNEEIAEARYVLKMSKNPLVRQFAQKMIDDHSQAKVSLQTAARSVPVPVPAKAGAANDMMRRELMTMTGSALDDAYMTGQAADHRKMLLLLKSEAAETKDPTLKAFALVQQPVVQDHLQMAGAYQVSGGTTMGGTPRVGNGVTKSAPTSGALNNGIPQSNGSSQNGGTSSSTGAGISGSNTGQAPSAGPTTAPVPGTKPTAVPSNSPTTTPQ